MNFNMNISIIIPVIFAIFIVKSHGAAISSKCPGPPACMIFCPYGFELGTDGCETCNCNPGGVSLSDCKTDGMFCRLYCPNGMVKDDQGCPLCQCNSST